MSASPSIPSAWMSWLSSAASSGDCEGAAVNIVCCAFDMQLSFSSFVLFKKNGKLPRGASVIIVPSSHLMEKQTLAFFFFFLKNPSNYRINDEEEREWTLTLCAS